MHATRLKALAGAMVALGFLLPAALSAALALAAVAAAAPNQKYTGDIDINPPPIASDMTVKYDYDIVYVRAPRRDPTGKSRWAEVGDPRTMEPGADLVLLHPDGKEEVLVPAEGNESIADPQVSFDGQWVYFAKFHDALNHKGSDIYKIHVPTRNLVQLTQQTFTPNAGVADWSKTPLPAWGVYNTGPCPLPGGRLAFVSDRNAFKATNPGYAPTLSPCSSSSWTTTARTSSASATSTSARPCTRSIAEGRPDHVQLAGVRGPPQPPPVGPLDHQPRRHALEPAHQCVRDRQRHGRLAALPDPALRRQHHRRVVLQPQQFRIRHILQISAVAARRLPCLRAGVHGRPRNARLRHGRTADGRGQYIGFPFSPHGIEAFTPFVLKGDWPSEPSVAGKDDSPRVGKFTHPARAPDDGLLTTWSAGSLNSYARYKPAFDSGIYLIKGGKPVDEPGQMLLIKNDPKYHEQWPRALVPYKRIYGIDEPKTLPRLANDGTASGRGGVTPPLLPEGTPFGLVGTSSLYKRESYPYGVVHPGRVTASYAGDKDPTGAKGFDTSNNWVVQGADAGLYTNDDIHAIRILLLEPTTEVGGPRTYYNHGHERMRILGEFPVRKFGKDGKQPTDPDGNPDTSFLAKIPADTAFTFQTLDKNGMVLNMAETWHQLRPGEIRTDCGGCHAHSQKPTEFKDAAAAKPDYKVFDLTERTPLLTTKDRDESKVKWDAKDETGLRYEKGVKSVEYYRDVKPILERSCVACHTKKADKPAGNLVLDDDDRVDAQQPAGLGFTIHVPGTYARLAADAAGKSGHKPLNRNGWTEQAASRYVRIFQSRRSLLIWKVFGKRLDGWDNDDFPHEAVPGDPGSLVCHGKPAPDTPQNRELSQAAYTGGVMPPPEAVEGTYVGPDGKKVKVAPLTAEDRLTLVRWIDLGCPIDLTPDGRGWALDDQRPTLALTCPRPAPTSR